MKGVSGIDEPEVVWKNGEGFAPHLSWRGGYEAGTRLSSGQLAEDIVWPARRRDLYYAPETRTGAPPAPNVWLGSLLDGRSDPTGLVYSRNRYYDPKSGRFTQEDPIGLAGGLNLYGFAGGDPVNYSDPFGLCFWDLCIGEGVAGYAMVAGVATIATAYVAQHGDDIRAMGNALASTVSGIFESRGGNMQPDPRAAGPHSTFRVDPTTGQVIKWQEWKPVGDPRNPHPFEPGKRYDGKGDPHHNKVTGEDVPTPHVHDPEVPGGVRPPKPDENPKPPTP